MKLGFTGTRDGMTEAQRATFTDLVKRLLPSHFGHGDCIGSDDQAATIVDEVVPDVYITCYPPIDDDLRANNTHHDEIRKPKTYFARNRDIVDENDAMVATPREMSHQSRGGTWYTVDYAKKKGKEVYIVYPDGSIFHVPRGFRGSAHQP